jgi:hypothetical protein
LLDDFATLLGDERVDVVRRRENIERVPQHQRSCKQSEDRRG